MGSRALLHPLRKADAQARHRDRGAFPAAAALAVRARRLAAQRADHPRAAAGRNRAALLRQGARRALPAAHRQHGFPLRHGLRRRQPRGLRAPPARRDARRPDPLHPQGRGGSGLEDRRQHPPRHRERRISPTLSLRGGHLGPAGRRSTAGAGRPRLEEIMSEHVGEPIPAGQAPQAWDELVIRFEQGFDLGRIAQLLQQARERGGQSQESVCTLNLVAIYFTATQYERARDAIEAAGSTHPCRLVVLVADQSVDTESLTARVSVVRSAGAISMERVVLTATGRAVRHLESAMLGLLLPELPMVVVWGGRPQGDLLQRAVESADRIIIDSGARPPLFLADTAQLVARGAPIGDLAWARIFPWQALAAEVLDLPNLREHRGNIRKARVVCAGALGAEGLLLAGWISSRIKRIEVSVEVHGDADDFDNETTVTTAIPRAAPIGLGHVSLFEFQAPPATFTFRRDKALLIAEVKGDDDGYVAHRVRLPPETPGRLLGLELKLLAGVDELYAQAVQAAVKLLPQGTA